MEPSKLIAHAQDLRYKDSRLFFGDFALDELGAKFKTPLYVYNLDVVRQNGARLVSALGGMKHTICYAVKANTSQGILKLCSELGFGADVVSVGELKCARKAKIDSKKIVFSGVAKTFEEIEYAVSEDILVFNVESPGEIAKIRQASQSKGVRSRISLRINPDIDAKTHPKIATGLHATKFGLETPLALSIAKSLIQDPDIELCGVSCHIGSQLLDLGPLREATQLVRSFVSELRGLGHTIKYIDLGGGLGVPYRAEDLSRSPGVEKYGQMLRSAMEQESAHLILEPGRALVAEAGVLLSKVIEVKKTAQKQFVMVDAGMNDLMRPALYDAYHSIVPVWLNDKFQMQLVDVVGPVCETGDFFAIDREIPSTKEGELLAITHSGAYGFSMASHYNLRAKPAEVCVSKRDGVVLTRPRESVESLF
jgi:diaminopimelate decarboxylase